MHRRMCAADAVDRADSAASKCKDAVIATERRFQWFLSCELAEFLAFIDPTYATAFLDQRSEFDSAR